MPNTAYPEDMFIDWFIRYETECAELREELAERLDEFAARRGLRGDSDPRQAFLRDYLFGDYEPI